MKSFQEILATEELDLFRILQQSRKYYAHCRDGGKELLADHTRLTVEYFLHLCEANGLEPIIDQLIVDIGRENLDVNSSETEVFVKSMFLKSIFFHDFGKVNENFQVEKMENSLFAHKRNGIGSDHSILSAYLFLAAAFKILENSTISQEDKGFLLLLVCLFTHPILKHHGHIGDVGKFKIDQETHKNLSEYLNLFTLTSGINKEHLKTIIERRDLVFEILNQAKASFQIFTLIKLSSSLLTASDYYATNEFMLGIKCEDFGTLTGELRNKFWNGVYRIKYNSELLNRRDFFQNQSFADIQSMSNQNLNLLRQKLSCEVLSNLEQNMDKRLFYIEAPTGSGKTNLSLLCLAELFQTRKDTNKVFYVFPFTTLITQTTSFLVNDLHIGQADLAEIHSKAPYHDKGDGQDYGTKRKNYIDNLFINYPISLISHVRFFSALTSNEKESNYLLHRLANSIVIIDEIQSYTPSEWDKINYLISSYSEAFNITFVVMSATLPKISKLLLNRTGKQKDDFTYLVTNKDKYYQSPNFKNRVTFRFDYLNEEFSVENLLSIVFQHSELYYKKVKHVKAIVEFVTKISAHEFYEKLTYDERFTEYKKFIISGTVLEPRRKEIIDFLKSNVSKEGKIIVVATQVVEAGLDIDMDIGFKDKSIVDAEEQLAGRINRNASKVDCEVVLFNSRDSSRTYGNDLRHKQHIDLEAYKRILTEKDFDSFYDQVFESINEANRDEFLANNLSDFKNQVRRLDYQEVHKQFALIKDNAISVFVPLKLSICHFTEGELKFLQASQVIGENEKHVDGTNVWALYTGIINNRDMGFIDKKIDLKILSPILSKYSFSVWNNRNQINLLKHYSDSADLEYGFLYLQYFEKVFSYEDGLRTDIETDCNFL